MAIGEDGRRLSQLSGCLERAATYQLAENEAREIVDRQIETIESQWDEVCDLASLTPVDAAYFMGRQFLNPTRLRAINPMTERKSLGCRKPNSPADDRYISATTMAKNLASEDQIDDTA